ncbi:uncharacterized protein LOC128169149 [Crassostrea angulata]|uniref:uncharacterized protein LOC128169149 n=1 Tax=Magallana angulata TaxID=2784310 RepID=UPI0022B1C1F2|nr:uncharacterized protein LOC128169149 [Crassostrea angulata]
MDGIFLGYFLFGFFKAVAAYVITTEAGQSYTDLATYGITAVNRTSLLLNVKGCDNAHIGIYQNGGVRQNMVEFVLGARMNDGYDIREYVNGALPVYQVSKKGVLLDCNEFRAFWISWGLTPAGHRSWLLGLGHEVFSDVIANFTNTQPDNGDWVSIGIAPYFYSSLQWEFYIEQQTTTESSLLSTDTNELATVNDTLTTDTNELATVNDTLTTDTNELATVNDTLTTDKNELATVNDTLTTDTNELATVNATLTRLDHSQFTTEPLKANFCGTETCACKTMANFTEEDLIEFVKNISRILKVDKKQTSLYRRSLISVREERTSAQVIGNVGLIFIVAVVGGICALDISRFLRSSIYILGKDDVISRGKSAA